MHPRERQGGRWGWICALFLLATCADHTEEDQKACAGYTCSAGACQAGPTGPQCVCGAAEQALGLTCTLLGLDPGNETLDTAQAVELGRDVEAAIATLSDVDVYRFASSPDRVYLVEVVSEIGLSVDLADETGRTLSSGTGTKVRLGAPSPTNTGFVLVHARDPAQLGRYVLRVSDLAPADGNDALSLDHPVDRTLAPEGERDAIVLDVPSGAYVATCAFEPPLTGTSTVRGWDSSWGFQVAPSGPAAVVLVEGQGVGRYRCAVAVASDDAGDSVEDARRLPGPPTTFDGQMDYVEDVDVYAFPGLAGQNIWAHVPGCRLGAVGGLAIDEWAYFGPTTDGLLEVLIQCAPRTAYRLDLTVLTDAEGPDAASAAPASGFLLSGRLDSPTDVDVIRFDAAEHHVYAAPVFADPNSCGWFASGEGVAVTFGQVQTVPSVLFSRDEYGPVFLSRGNLLHCLSFQPHTYADEVVDVGMDPEPGTPAAAVPATIGQTVQGTSQYPGDIDCFGFDVPDSASYWVVSASVPFVLHLPDGTSVASSVANRAIIPAGTVGHAAVCAQANLWLDGIENQPLVQTAYTLLLAPSSP